MLVVRLGQSSVHLSPSTVVFASIPQANNKTIFNESTSINAEVRDYITEEHTVSTVHGGCTYSWIY